MKYRWSIAPTQPVLVQHLSRELHLGPLLAQCLLNRGLSEPNAISRFLAPRLKDLSDPFLLPDMAAAVDRLYLARERSEPVVIFGDYDVDGVTATALLHEVMQDLGWTVHCYLPHRMDEGYGLSQTGVENCLKKYPTRLLLAVDCGSTTGQTIDWLQRQGVDVLVLDHHQASHPLPSPLAFVNPKAHARLASTSENLPADVASSVLASETEELDAGPSSACALPVSIPFAELCSAGLAFKMAHALVKRGRDIGLEAAKSYDIRPCLDLAALGTIADVVPLQGENRILVNTGIERLNQTKRPGLLALREVARIANRIGAHEVAWQLAPRLNAAGRLESALDALHLLQTRNLADALPLAQCLDAQNTERRNIEHRISQEAIERVRARFNPSLDYVIVEGDSQWHIGVAGIVAGRVLSQFYRPTIILGGDGAQWRGSGRSIAGFDLAAALRQCHPLLTRYGGHAMAAGLTISAEKVDSLRMQLNECARRLLTPDHLQPGLTLDAEVMLGEITLDLVKDFERLQHSGMGNPPVQLCVRNVGHQRALQRMGLDRKHAKLWLTDGQQSREAVIWGVGDGPLPVGRFDLAFTPQLNHYNGTASVQLKVLDWQAVP